MLFKGCFDDVFYDDRELPLTSFFLIKDSINKGASLGLMPSYPAVTQVMVTCEKS
jgi:hypothetical protein